MGVVRAVRRAFQDQKMEEVSRIKEQSAAIQDATARLHTLTERLKVENQRTREFRVELEQTVARLRAEREREDSHALAIARVNPAALPQYVALRKQTDRYRKALEEIADPKAYPNDPSTRAAEALQWEA